MRPHEDLGAERGGLDAQTVLLVDDDDTFRERMAKALHARGYSVRTAGAAGTALELARREPPELAVIDLRMPDQSGLELVRDLALLDAGIRIIMLTGYGSIATAVDAVRLGAQQYVTKPIDADELIAAFERAGQPPVLSPIQGETEFATPSLARNEWEHIQRVLSDCGGNISEAARRLGLHRRSLQRKLNKYPPRS
jgi:two-component system, response regulator RegA